MDLQLKLRDSVSTEHECEFTTTILKESDDEQQHGILDSYTWVLSATPASCCVCRDAELLQDKEEALSPMRG
jgi:hypothetical protein